MCFRKSIQRLMAVLPYGSHAVLDLQLRAVIIPVVVMLEPRRCRG